MDSFDALILAGNIGFLFFYECYIFQSPPSPNKTSHHCWEHTALVIFPTQPTISPPWFILLHLNPIDSGNHDVNAEVMEPSKEELAPPSPGLRLSEESKEQEPLPAANMTYEEELADIQMDLSRFLFDYDQFVNCLHPSDGLDCSDLTDVRRGWNVTEDSAVLFRNIKHTQPDDDAWDDVFMKLGHAVKTVGSGGRDKK